MFGKILLGIVAGAALLAGYCPFRRSRATLAVIGTCVVGLAGVTCYELAVPRGGLPVGVRMAAFVLLATAGWHQAGRYLEARRREREERREIGE